MFCRNCGSQSLYGAVFCTGCGVRLAAVSNVRREFGLTYLFALLTAFFWICQFIFPAYSISLFAPLVSLLSWNARVCFIVSYVRSSKNWLAVSAISSTSSLALWILGGLPFGSGPWDSWPDFMTMVFSLATLTTYFIQARKAGVRPYVIERRSSNGTW